jgi:hypothetical protein
MLSHEHTVLDILINLPTIGRMNFLDIDREEVDSITIGAVNPIEGPSLGPKRRSGITSKDQRNRPIHKPIRQSNLFALTSVRAGLGAVAR